MSLNYPVYPFSSGALVGGGISRGQVVKFLHFALLFDGVQTGETQCSVEFFLHLAACDNQWKGGDASYMSGHFILNL